MSEYSYKGEPMSLAELVECLNRDDQHPERGKIVVDKEWNSPCPCRGNKQNGTYEGWWLNGQKAFEECYENGQLKERVNYVDNFPQGVDEEWYENGQLKSRRNYKHGLLNGFSDFWDEDGKLMERWNFKDAVGTLVFKEIKRDQTIGEKKEINLLKNRRKGKGVKMCL